MSNTIQIKHGEGLPDDGVLKPYELGFDTERQALYIGNESQEPAPVIAEHAYGADYANTAGWAAYGSFSKNAEYAEMANLDINGNKLTERVQKIEIIQDEEGAAGLKIYTSSSGQFTVDLRSFSAPRLARYNSSSRKYDLTNIGDNSTPVYFKDGIPVVCTEASSSATYYGSADPNNDDGKPDGTIYYRVW